MIIFNFFVSFCILVFKGISLLSNGLFSVLKLIVRIPVNTVIYAFKGIVDIIVAFVWTLKKILNIVLLVLKNTFNTLRKMIKSVLNILHLVVKNIYKVTSLVIKKTFGLIAKLLKIIGNIIKTIFMFIVKSIWKVIKFILDLISGFFQYAYKGVLVILTLIFKGIFSVIKKLSNGVFFILKHIFKFIGYIFLYALYGIRLILNLLFKAVKYVINNFNRFMSFVLKYIFKALMFVITKFIRFGTLIVQGLIKVVLDLYRFIFLFGFGIYTSVIYIVNAILYFPKLIIKSVINFVSNFKESINNYILKPIQNVADYLAKTYKIIHSRLVALPKDIKTAVLEWYNNLTFIKHMHNKRDMSRQVLLIDFNSKDAKRSDKKIVWQYYAKDANGKYIRGVFEAFSKLDVHSFLMSEGYEVYDIKTSKSIDFFFGGRNSSNVKVKPKQLIFFLTQLSTYIRAGIPLTDSVRILARQEKSGRMQRLYQSIIYELIMGENFSKALEKQGEAFPKLLVNMLRTSEMTGELAETLDDMSEYYGAMYKLKKQTMTSMMYPIVVLFFVVVVIVFIMIYVIPQFVEIYKDSDAELPTITVITIGVSSFLQKNIVFVIIGVILFGLLIRFLYRNVKLFKTIMQWIIMHIPVIKNVIIYNEITMFTKTFSALLRHNVFITECMEILSKITNNEIYKMIVFDSISSIAKGDSISSSFKNHWAIPQLAYEMMLTGERTGQLPLMMGKVATYYQDEQKNLVNQIKTLIEPIVIVFLAATVGIILLAVVIPMFNLYSDLSSGV